jgi:outer membrane protein OmpA-like peptidoglycan-associated protein
VSRLTEAEFRTQLGSTPQQEAAIDALFGNATFTSLWDYLRGCRATPPQDLGPLALKVTPGLHDGSVVRFGGYTPATRTLEINPTKPEHLSNPTELVDTITHELIHAEDDLQPKCVAAGSGPAPLLGAATARERSRSGISAAHAQELERDQGPGASDPCGEFLDINAAAQSMITAIMTENVQVATVGRPTAVFVNVIIRRNPAAMAAYEPCRTRACGLPDGPAREQALGTCAADTIARFIPPDLTPALLPGHIHFDLNSARIRADDVPTVDLVGLFLVAHPAVRVRLVGHTDPTGPPAFNRELSRRRAAAVLAALRAKGVRAAQIISVTSVGSRGRISTTTARHWQDRRVDILP